MGEVRDWTPISPLSIVGLTGVPEASRWFARRNSPYGIAGSPEMGSELRLLAKLDPDVAVMLAGKVRY